MKLSNMDNYKEQLTASLRVFLFLDAYGPRNPDLYVPIKNLKMSEKETLDDSLALMAIHRWQLHHAFHVNQPDLLEYSITDLVSFALQSEQLEDEEHQLFVENKVEEISELLQKYVNISYREQSVIEEAEYLVNLN